MNKLAEIVKRDYLWDFSKQIRYKKEILLTGDKEERAQKRDMISFEEGNVCDCCEIPLPQTPWRK